ncbi:type II toxin-antitoxin system RelE family toxin [Hydrogenimonas thermophila]|uniref:mRNA-degrading endonuclease RelE, toxin component of the RelBE toxin-antitoxin system n=1 Tax=Hydrogenimonas thermophila TaxID=223786 RepID=A0A1I5QNB0_9BACT|nr:type II toxin-antitoxin system RelE/ParE family toxin [Hydrogenimonas thermophila]WOE71150.1 type II toxin-antitoxin system RelE/ParE family toxin [Hydrogenimonas thermophila]WOE73668.1 type II toxin-antitoxin system RelE/ParE family toxin [Hydrogenimonas thermophila]SFP47754.1 mRNA-degrading endonuclease RelE, toxin component of the RelBE toxin-antitoxin system [Hydrogenimonas thermophila]
MNYKINYVPSFGKDLKKLSRKYRSIKKDYENLLKILSINEPHQIGTPIGKNCYKLRLKNSDNQKGKSGGYRVIYFYIENDDVTLLAIYSKSEIENIDENEIEKRLLEKLS